jgi:hypothetical protein
MSKTYYLLEIRPKNLPTQRLTIKEKITVGKSEKADITIEDHGLDSLQAIFRLRDESLYVQSTSKKNNSSIGSQEMIPKKMYMLDQGDKITFGNVEIYIRTSDTEVAEEENISLHEEDKTFKLDLSQIRGEIPLKEKKKEKIIDPPDQKQKVDLKLETVQIKPKLKQAPHPEPAKPKTVNLPKDHSKGKSTPPAIKPVNFKPKVQVQEDPSEGPNIILRFYSFLFDLCASFALYQVAAPTLMAKDSPLSSIRPHLDKLIKENLKEYQDFPLEQAFVFLVLFIILQFIYYSTLSLPLPYLLLSYKRREGFLAARIKGIINFLLTLITLPLLIFDFPLLIGKRPLREVLSGTFYDPTSGPLKVFSIIILFPVLMFSLVNIPVFIHYKTYLNPVKLDKSYSFKSTEKQLTALPKIAKKSLTLQIFTEDYKSSIELKKINSFSLQELWRQYKSSNPMAKVLYPELATLAVDDSKEKKKPDEGEESENEDNFIPTKDLTKTQLNSLLSLIQTSFTANVETIPQTLISHGPFLAGTYSIQNFIKEKMRINRWAKSYSIFASPKRKAFTLNFKKGSRQVLNVLLLDHTFLALEVNCLKTKLKKCQTLLKNYLSSNPIKEVATGLLSKDTQKLNFSALEEEYLFNLMEKISSEKEKLGASTTQMTKLLENLGNSLGDDENNIKMKSIIDSAHQNILESEKIDNPVETEINKN